MPTIDNPILNSPFLAPTRHWRLDDAGIPTDSPDDGRRASEYIVPVPPSSHQTGKQATLDLDADTGERKSNDHVNELRTKVGLWRALPDAPQSRSVTPVTARLLRH